MNYLVRYLLLIGKYLIYWDAMTLTTLNIILALDLRWPVSKTLNFLAIYVILLEIAPDASFNNLGPITIKAS